MKNVKDRAIAVPCKMAGCLKLEQNELMQLKQLLHKAIIQTEE